MRNKCNQYFGKMRGLILHSFPYLGSLGCTGNTKASLVNEARKELYASSLPLLPSKYIVSTTVDSPSHAVCFFCFHL